MKEQIQSLLQQALQATATKLGVAHEAGTDIQVEHTRDSNHGDFASNIAMANAKVFRSNPRKLAEEIISQIPTHEMIEKIDVAGPGFINFYVKSDSISQIIPRILTAGDQFGHSDVGQGQKVLVEFVSANPTGPLHIGHGRGAAYGDTISSLLQTAGYNVTREYYVNDAGRQMDILAVSIWLKYLAQHGVKFYYPPKAYQADYISDIAKQLYQESNKKYYLELDKEFEAKILLLDEESQLDALIEHGKEQLGTKQFREILNAGLETILSTIRTDLENFGVSFDNWFSEQSLSEDKQLEKSIGQLTASKKIYEKDGASWFASTEYGDEKDRVVKRDNGVYTYFASDIAYHTNKLQRGFDRIINIWGADHHGYIKRVQASLEALGEDANKLNILLVQFATLYRGGEKMQMSTRSGQYVTLQELVDEVGTDAARFFYVMRKSEQHLDFDLDLAKSQSNDNPVYYIQYAHARICSVWKEMQQKNYSYDQKLALDNLQLLNNENEQKLITHLSKYEEQLINSATAYEPHSLCFFLRELAHCFHSYYNTHKFLIEQTDLRNARLALISATRQVLSNGLTLLGVSAPEEM